MDKWTDYYDIKNILNKKWNNKYILKSVFLKDDFFPLSIPLKYPKADEFEFLPDIIKWNENLKSHENLEFKHKVIKSKVHGKNTIPSHVIIKDVKTAVKIIKKEKELKEFLQNSEILTTEFPILKDWIAKNVILVSEIKEIQAIVKVLKWFLDDNDTNIYLRQICIEGIHTKFIEKNNSVISKMLDIVLPSEKINFNETKFEPRYKLKSPPNNIRFRILDDNFAINGLKDLTIPITDFKKLEIGVKNIFFTENKTNFDSFPNKKSSCVIFGRGYGIGDLKNIKNLHEKNLYYWGDIDTDGFNILSIARENFKNIKSILMTEEILLSHKQMWSKEKKQFVGEVHNLTSEELAVYTKLKNNFYGEKVRLEQELIDMVLIENFEV